MKLSIVVPVYNESPHLEQVVDFLMGSPCPIEREWIFVEDCSTDHSREILSRLAQKYRFNLLLQEYNQGKGAAVIRGIKEASGDFVMIQDADFEYDPYDVPLLVRPLLTNQADVIYGSRFKKNAPQVHRTYHYFVNRFLTLLSNLACGLYMTDMETCYKIFKRDLIQSMQLTSKRFGIEVEMTAYIAKTSARIFEYPIHYYPRTQIQGKKINWKDGVAALFHIFRFNFRVDVSQAFKNLPPDYDPQLKKKRPHNRPAHYPEVSRHLDGA